MTAWNNFFSDYLSKLYIPRIGWTDVIEIIIIAVVLYNILVWIKNTKAWALLKGIIIVVLFALFAYILNLKTILWIAGKTISVGIIALVIIFQPELRSDCLTLVKAGKRVNASAAKQPMRLSVPLMKWERCGPVH